LHLRRTARLSLGALALLAVAATGCNRGGDSSSNDNNESLQRCGEGWVLVPKGPFTMGVDPNDPRVPSTAFWDSLMRHTVQMSDYCIGRTEVSVAEYRKCVDAGACELPDGTNDPYPPCNYTAEPGDREHHPVNCIGWDRARAYCQWIGGDLPSEAQWEKAARGTDERWYPWGEATPDCSRCNYDENGMWDPDTNEGAGNGCGHSDTPMTWEVGHLTSHKGDSPYGVKDMAGNVDELVLDCGDLDFYQQCAAGDCTDPVNLHDGECWHGTRGGGATASPENVDSVEPMGGDSRSAEFGFRCAKVARSIQ